MIWVFVLILVVGVIFGPSIWVRWVMHAHDDEIDGMPGTGGELAEHLLQRFKITDVVVETTEQGDHYSPSERTVRLSPKNYSGKSLTAVAIAAHEVGHAIQHHRKDPAHERRTALVPFADRIARASTTVLWAAPVVGLLTRHPMPFSILVMVGISGLVARMLVHLVTIPVEWDASFAKALPALAEGQYVAPEEMPKVHRVLQAAALTYVAAALADILNLARWAALLLRR